MSDTYLKFVNTAFGKTAAQSLGLPVPIPLERRDSDTGAAQILVGAAKGALAMDAVRDFLASTNHAMHEATGSDFLLQPKDGSANWDLTQSTDGQRFKTLIFDASGISQPDQLRALYDFFHPTVRKLERCGRVIVIGQEPSACRTAPKTASQKALEGFVKSVAKEVGKKGSTANLIFKGAGVTDQLGSTIQFLMSPRSAYVSGQIVTITKADLPARKKTVSPLKGKVAIVTGASRGIGASIAETLALDGAKVIGVDIPSALGDLSSSMSKIQGEALACDITAEDAPETICSFLKKNNLVADIVVHNAGITRDKTLGNMPEHFWDMTIAVNLAAEEHIDAALLESDLLAKDGRIVCVSSIAGIAGNFGQTNYAAAKSGVIGYVEAMAKGFKDGRTINAVAPGFIETQMTAAIPLGIREAGRRMNSLSQGGQPVDVAETIAWFCRPDSAGVNGNVVRVCGQSLIGR